MKLGVLITLLVTLAILMLALGAIAQEVPVQEESYSLEEKVMVKRAIMHDEVVNPGDIAEVRVTLDNIDGDLNEVKISAFIVELGVRGWTQNFDLDDRNKESRTIFIDIPEDAEPGFYTVRISISSDEGRLRTVHREIEVV